jgi:dienelactone hydrolase
MDEMTAEIAVSIPPKNLAGDLAVCEAAPGVILFAHGSGSSRHSVRNRRVAHVLQQAGFSTLLLDLLTSAEEEIDVRTAQFRFDIPLLAGRLIDAIDWLKTQDATKDLPIALFGASTGAAAALVAASRRSAEIAAVVSRGGRPDLAGAALTQVQAPTLFIVGGEDHAVMPLNREALARLQCRKTFSIVPGATHLFEEPGTLEEVSMMARQWFVTYLRQRGDVTHDRASGHLGADSR